MPTTNPSQLAVTSLDDGQSSSALSQDNIGVLGGVNELDGDDHGGGGDKGNSGGGNDKNGNGGDKGSNGGGDNKGVNGGNSGNTGGGNGGNQGTGTGSVVTGSTGSEGKLRIEASAQAFVGAFQAELDARFELENNQARLRVEVESLDLPTGTTLNVCIAGQGVGTLMVSAFHSGELELESEHGQIVPRANPGDVLEIRQDPCGSNTQPIMAARFGGGAVVGAPAARLEANADALIQGFQAELKADFQDLGNNRRKLSIEVVNLNLPVGTALSFCVAAGSIGAASLDATHMAELALDSQKGDSIPAVKAGDIIEVRTDACGSATSPTLAARFGGGPVADFPAVRLEGKTEQILLGFEAELSVIFEALNGRMRLSAEVENLNLAVGTVISACSSGITLGSFTLDVNHMGKLDLDSQNGTSIPLINAGAVIEIRPGACSDMTAALLSVMLR